jgi:hypothetical protein
MKVYIGPYKNWVGPYQMADWLQRVGVNKDTCHDIGAWLDEKTPLGKICNWLYSKNQRKIKIRIDKYDTWGMDHTLALIILPMLKQLKETKHGSPGDMPAFDQTSNSAQGSFEFYAEGDDASWDEGHKQWEVILDEMIWAFEQLVADDWEDQYWKIKPELDMADYPEDEGKVTVPVRWKVKGECDWEGMRKHQERITAALTNFGRYFEGLWD